MKINFCYFVNLILVILLGYQRYYIFKQKIKILVILPLFATSDINYYTQ